jgi:CRP-like cAMP-binding protein
VQIITENGDTSILPIRALAQAVVTNLYAPSGLHRRTLKLTVAAHESLPRTLAALELALGGIPHLPKHKPEVVTHSFDLGGVVLELRFWASGWRDGRVATYQAVGIAGTVLSRLGVPLLGPHGATAAEGEPLALAEGAIEGILEALGLPREWAPEVREDVLLRRAAPGEAVIREGDAGESLFMVMAGTLQAVRAVERTRPYTGLFWETLGTHGPGDWFGEGSLLTGAPRHATVVAVTECELVEVPRAAFEHDRRTAPELVERLAELRETRTARPAVPPRASHREQFRKDIRRWFGLE